MIAASARTPITMPAIAPPEMLEDFELLIEADEGVAEEFDDDMDVPVLELVEDDAEEVVGAA